MGGVEGGLKVCSFSSGRQDWKTLFVFDSFLPDCQNDQHNHVGSPWEKAGRLQVFVEHLKSSLAGRPFQKSPT